MKLLPAATALLCLAPFSTAIPSIFGSSQDPLLLEALPVKGDNPLEYCVDPAGNILDIKSVDLAPNPPKPGQTLTIKASGVLHERIEKGAYVLLEVKYGLITLLRQKPDLCDQIVNVDLKCPLEPGTLSLTKQVDLPSQIPPGRYTVHADVYSKDDERITCLDARNIQF